jgi:hypothetical protein
MDKQKYSTKLAKLPIIQNADFLIIPANLNKMIDISALEIDDRVLNLEFKTSQNGFRAGGRNSGITTTAENVTMSHITSLKSSSHIQQWPSSGHKLVNSSLTSTAVVLLDSSLCHVATLAPLAQKESFWLTVIPWKLHAYTGFMTPAACDTANTDTEANRAQL